MAVFGRTNVDVPPVWFRPLTGGDPEALMAAIAEEPTYVDVSSSPGLWGHLIRPAELPVVIRLGLDVERATSASHAETLVEAEMVQALSGIGRSRADFVAFRHRRALEDFQIEGALSALETAKNDGLAGFIGLSVEGPALASIGLWTFHDAFEFVLAPHDGSGEFQSIQGMAATRRAGLVSRIGRLADDESLVITAMKEGVVLADVQTPEDVRRIRRMAGGR